MHYFFVVLMSLLYSCFDSLRVFFRNIKNTRGNAIVVSSVTVSVVALSVISVSTLITDSESRTRDTERSIKVDAAVDASLETAVYDSLAQPAGYRVDERATSYNTFQFGGDGTAQWSVNDRAHIVDMGDSQYTEIYEDASLDGYMAYPAPGLGTSSDDTAWNSIRVGERNQMELYVNNLSRSMCADEECSSVIGE